MSLSLFYTTLISLFSFFPTTEPSTILSKEKIKPIPSTTIVVRPEGERFPLMVTQSAQKVVLQNLEVGAEYEFFFYGSREGLPDGKLLFQGKEVVSPVIFKATSKSATFDVQVAIPTRQTFFNENYYISYGKIGFQAPPVPLLSNASARSMLPISTTVGNNVTNLIKNTLIGTDCFEITNVSVNAQSSGRWGTFSNGGSSIGIANGMIMTTGSMNVGVPSSTWLSVQGAGTYNGNGLSLQDAVVIDFDMKPTTNMVSFDYVFASEEYCQYVNQINDAFGFFITGPGIAGTYNMATVGGTNVSINNVNQNVNSTFYYSNYATGTVPYVPTFVPPLGVNGPACTASHPNGPTTPNPAASVNECGYNGFTKVLTATSPILQPCQFYHIKLVIGDSGDKSLDSGVFIKGNSLNAETYVVPSIYNATDPTSTNVKEGCENGVLKICRPPGADITIPKTVTWSLTGSTATSGVDYVPFGTSAVIPAGQDCIEIPITILLDQVNEPDEIIKVTVNESCKCSAYELTIKDPPLLVTFNDVTVCSAASVTLTPTVSGGMPNYTYVWSPSGSGSSYTFTASTLPSVTTYNVTVTDMCGHIKVDDSKVTVQGVPTANMTSTTGSLCAGGNTTLNVNLTGTPPWQLTYTLNGTAQAPVTINSTPYAITVTQPGTYAISAVNYPGSPCPGTFSGSAVVQQSNPDATIAKTNVNCNAANDGTLSITGLTGGIAPYTYLWSNASTNPNLTGLAPGTYTVTITDNIGCKKVKTDNITQPPVLVATTTASTAQTCVTQGTGTVSVTGGTPAYTYLWNNPSGSTTQNLSGAAAGTYILTVTDSKGCQDTAKVVILPNNTLPTATAVANVTVNCTTPLVPINGTGSSTGANFTYNWSGPGVASGGNTLNPNINAGGTYILTVTNTNNGCTQTASVTIPENKTLPTAVTVTPPPITCANTSISISAVGSSTGANFTYNWSGPGIVSGGTTLTPTVNQIGTYTITVTDIQNGCTKTATVSVIENKTLPTADAGPDKLLNCYNNQSVSIGTAAVGGFTYNWSNNITTATQTVTTAGTYTLTVTDPVNGCTKTDVVVVTEDIVKPVLSPIPAVTVNCFTPNPTLVATATGSNLVYTWSPSGPTISAGGTYMVTVTNSVNGCKDTKSITVPEDKADPTAVIAPPAVLTCGNNSSIALDATGSSTGATYTYNWSGPGGFSSTSIPPPNATVAGTYILTVTNSVNGCKKTASVSVTENKVLPTADAGPDKLLNCYNNQSVSIGTAAAGGFTYNWSNNITTATQTVTTAGTYTLTVTDPVNGCTKTDAVVVTEDIVKPVLSPIPVVTVNCFTPNPTLVATATGSNLVYTWSPSGPTISAGGTYMVTVTNSVNGCTDTKSVIIPEDKADPTAVINFSNPIYCNSPSATLNTTGSSTGANFAYSWTGPSGFTSSSQNPSITVGGAYKLTITNTTNGCIKVATVNVPEDKTAPAAAITNTPTITCANATVQLNGTGATGANFTYNWSATNGGNISGGGTTLTPTVNQAGTYILTVTNSTTGCTNTAQVVVNEDKVAPVINTTGAGVVTCTNPILSLGTTVVSGANLQFQWSSPTGGIVGNANQQNISVNLGGTYTVTVTNSVNGCSVTSSVTTTQDNTPPTVNATPSGIIDCINLTASINGTSSSTGANFVYNWTGPNGFSNNTTLTPTVNTGGAYTLSITNTTNGCVNTKTILVTEDKVLPLVNILTPAQLTCTSPSVTISAAGNITYLYSWTATSGGNIVSGANNQNVSVNQVGTYNLNVINPQNGCQLNASTNVTENKVVPVASIATPLQITCPVPIVTLNAIGSSQGGVYQIQWSANPGSILSGINTLQPTVNAAGTYTLNIKDLSNGCEKSASVTVIDQRVYPNVQVANASALDCNTTSLTLNGLGSSTGLTFSYIWQVTNGGNITAGQGTLEPTIDKGGTYTLVVTDITNNCSTNKSVIVSQNTTKPIANAGPAKVITCVSNSVQLQGSGSTGSSFQYQWSNSGGNIASSSGGNTFTPTVSQVGDYTFTVKDLSNGCSQSAITSVSLDLGVPTANAGTKKEINCNVPQVTLDGTASTTGANLTYTWTTSNGAFVSGQNTLQPIVNKPGTYNLEIINTANSCKGNASVQVEDNRIKPTLKIAKFGILNCANASLTLNGNGSSTGASFTYNWTGTGIVSGATTLAPVIDKAGVFNFKIKNNQNGCEKDSSVTIVENTNKPVPVIAAPVLLTCTKPTQILDASGSTKIQNAKIQWVTSVVNGVSAGGNTLKPTITDEGDYKLILTDTISKCKDSIIVNVKKDANIPQANAGATAELNCTVKDITLGGTGSSGGNITYSWTTVGGNIVSGGTTLTPKINAAGKYTLKVFNATNQCTKESTVDITQDTLKPTLKIAKPAILNCKTTVMSLDASTSSTGANFTFTWTTPAGVNFVSGATTLSPLVNKPGTYSLSITNTKNTCVSKNTVIVTQDIVKPQANIAKTDTLNCRNFSLKLKGTASANSGFYTFMWKEPTSNAITKDGKTLEPSINQPGDYQLVVTDTVNFCASTAQITVIKNVLTPVVKAGAGGNLTCTIKDLTLKATATNGVPSDFIYTWTTSNGNIVGATNTLNAKIDVPGKYFFEVENKINGCKSKDSTSVTQDANVPKVEILTNGDLDCKTKTLVLDGTGSSQGAGITFTWSTKNGGNIVSGQNTLKPTVNSAGVYILQINNSNNNCIKDIEKTIKIDTIKPVINVTQDLITCAKPKVELSGKIFQANKYTFEWQTATGGILSNKDSLQILINQKGIYTLKVKNTENECENSKIVNVLEDKILPTVDAGAALEINCKDSILTLQGDKSSKGNEFVYNWTTNSGNILSDEKTLNPKIDKAAPYFLLITNKNNGCQNKDTVLISVNKIIPLITIVKPDTIICKKPIVDLKANATVTGSSGSYTWSTVNGNIVNGKTSPTTSVNQPGLYILQVMDTKNFCKSNKQVDVPIDTTKPKVNAGANIELNCKSPTIDVSATATAKQPLTFLWTTTNGTIVKDADKLKVTVKSAGIYQFVATNTVNGCTATDEMEVTFLGAPKAIVLPPQVLTCAKTSIVLDSKGSDVGSNFTYTWSDVNGNTLGTNPTLNATKPGLYNFKVYNSSNECEKKVQITVTQDIEAPTADAGKNGVIDCEKGYVVINGKGSSQGAKYTYLWTGGLIESGATTLEAKVTAQAIYKLLVTNTENGCQASDTVAVLSLKPAILETVVTDPPCNGDKGAILFKAVSGGTPPFTYSIDGGKNYKATDSFKGLKPGNYTVFVQDTKGCEDSTIVRLRILKNSRYRFPKSIR
jgi:SprB repeat